MKIRKAVIPVAGLGTRFLPATKASPKEMLPLVDKPLIQYVVEEAKASGIEEIIIVTGRGKRAIEDHFDSSVELEYELFEKKRFDLLEEIKNISNMVTFAYTRQKKALGLGHAILCAEPIVGNEPFAVFLGDDIIDSRVPCMKQLIDVYEEYHGSVIAIQEVKQKETKSYGIIKPRKMKDRVYKVLDLVEKPEPTKAPSNLAVIGRYILSPEIFRVLKKTSPGKHGEIQLTDGLKTLLKEENIYGCEFSGVRYDAGDKLGFLKATVEFALKRKDLGKEFKKYLKQLDL
ncbi:MAG: UTP--glucose-1-phosphate uridylyltransferase [Candidatus Schekmanbacteria bacterium RBG_16_38_11]|uniref:UTP--glucose-1-phosphate uridylyltransferase n=2 Tax=Candidatus Schekmaniibacteriota TaxID=1817811 RepID=A0A1F7RA23_9BACT|nr:MAG: UTP--glucose-1-phosphate uridylyltransferase [Candidatus Schekmanbacteria bacterium GWA2_38_11]OGL44920.1 MAG: UTP--glucose-1-phosphate uridylyltransferase [Candidatus Schekmanbacteria bacterium RBG_16_38_11]